MISNPKNGWCDFVLKSKDGNGKEHIFYGHPSYIRNVPVDLLEAVRDYLLKGQSVAFFDEEGTSFSLVFAPYSLYLIEEKDGVALNNVVLHDYSSLDTNSLVDEIVKDVELNLEEWVNFSAFDAEESMNNRTNIVKLVEQIKSLKKREEGI